jgi:hypothetical protein
MDFCSYDAEGGRRGPARDLTARRLPRIIPRRQVPRMIRPPLVAGLAAAGATLSSGHEFPIFEACYREKATPIWGAHCKAEPTGLQCRR